jgi:hypothetical protein
MGKYRKGGTSCANEKIGKYLLSGVTFNTQFSIINKIIDDSGNSAGAETQKAKLAEGKAAHW